jgi:hypothetical protein
MGRPLWVKVRRNALFAPCPLVSRLQIEGPRSCGMKSRDCVIDTMLSNGPRGEPARSQRDLWVVRSGARGAIWRKAMDHMKLAIIELFTGVWAACRPDWIPAVRRGRLVDSLPRDASPVSLHTRLLLTLLTETYHELICWPRLPRSPCWMPQIAADPPSPLLSPVFRAWNPIISTAWS